MRTTQTIETITCDVCKKFIPSRGRPNDICIKSIEIHKTYNMDLVNTINLDLRCNIPYSDNYQYDICETCFYEMLEKHIKEWKNKRFGF